MVYQLNAFVVLTAVTAVPPVMSQGIPPGSSYTGSSVAVAAPQLLVTNPFLVGRADAENPTDSTNSVTVGTSLRNRLTQKLGTDWQVITRLQMNNALVQWGYPADAMLTPSLAHSMAANLNVRAMVTTYMNKGAGGYNAVIRVTNAQGQVDLGASASVDQAQGQNLTDYAEKLGDAITPLVKDFLPAKECVDLASTNPKKATDDAKKVLKDVPGYALAEYCLAQIAQATDSNSAEALADYQAAAKGDSLSIVPWTQIADIHRRLKDSNSVVADFQHMLRIDPTNQKLAETARKYFILYNRRDAAKQVVEEQLKNDPNNPDWLDLESNYCIADSDFKCVVDALSKVYLMDSTRADTTFYAKILYAASQPPADTSAYMSWAQRGAKKYPNNGDILEALARAYAMTGQDDSAVAVANRMMQADPTKTDALMFVVQGLINAKRYPAAASFTTLVKQVGDDQAKQDYAGLLVQATDSAYVAENAKDSTQVKDWSTVGMLARASLAVGSTNDQINSTAHFFAGLATYFKLSDIVKQAYDTKSCDLTKQIDSVATSAAQDLTAAQSSSSQAIVQSAGNLLQTIQQEQAAVPNWTKAFCKPQEQ